MAYKQNLERCMREKYFLLVLLPIEIYFYVFCIDPGGQVGKEKCIGE